MLIIVGSILEVSISGCELRALTNARSAITEFANVGVGIMLVVGDACGVDELQPIRMASMKNMEKHFILIQVCIKTSAPPLLCFSALKRRCAKSDGSENTQLGGAG